MPYQVYFRHIEAIFPTAQCLLTRVMPCEAFQLSSKSGKLGDAFGFA